MSDLNSSSYITCDLPGIGGEIKQRPEDFVVEEQLTYDLDKEGGYFYLFIETIGRQSVDTANFLAKQFCVTDNDITYVSCNDKNTVSRQVFSVYLPKQNKLDEKSITDRITNAQNDIKILWTDRHSNKLESNYIEGNRYVIRIRKVKPMDVLVAKQILDHLEQYGLANSLNKGESTLGDALRDPDVSGGVDEYGPYIRLTFELKLEVKVDTVLQELMKTNL